MSDPTARDRAYICDARLDTRDGSETQGAYIPSLVYEAAGNTVLSYDVLAAPMDRLKVIVRDCTDFLDDAIMGVAGVKRTTI